MTLSVKYLNDLLELDNQPRSLNDDERYILARNNKLIPLSEWNDQLRKEINDIQTPISYIK